jgi:hypothetical protein
MVAAEVATRRTIDTRLIVLFLTALKRIVVAVYAGLA